MEPLRFRRMPVFAAVLAFACGDILARRWHGPMLLATATLVLFLISLLALRKAPRVAVLPVLALWVSLGCWCAQIQPPVSAQPDLKPFADGLSRNVRGRIVRVRTLAAPTKTHRCLPLLTQQHGKKRARQYSKPSISMCRLWKRSRRTFRP
jgi:competence protein ComEC